VKLSLKNIYDFLEIQNGKNMDQAVLGVSIDSRSIRKGELFVALQGETFNGHQFIEESINKGAVAAVVDRKYTVPENIKEKGIIVPVNNTLSALQQIARKYRHGFNIPVIGITGSNGKTTTKEMIAEILSTNFNTVKSQGNYNNHIGVPLSILQWDEDAEVAVMELGTNHFGEIHTLCTILNPTHGVITNIGKAHLKFFDSLEGVTKAKQELIEYLSPQGHAILNGDDPFLYPLRNMCEKTVLYGFSHRCDVRGEHSRIDAEGYPSMKVDDKKIKLMIPGLHNLSNALAGIAVARSLQVKDTDIINILTNYQPIQNRMNIVYDDKVKIINDTYNANPSSMLESLKTLKIVSNKGGRSIAVLGDMMELGSHSKAEHRNIGEKAYRIGIDALFCYGEMGEYVYEGALHAGMKNIYYYFDKVRLLEDLNSFMEKGDVILVKGSRSMKMEDIIRGIKLNQEC